jgi:hypothetical protein
VKQSAQQDQANKQRQNGRDQARDRLNGFRDNRIPNALLGDLTAFVLQGITLLIDARTLRLDLPMQF